MNNNEKDSFSTASDVLKKIIDRVAPQKTIGYSGVFSGWNEIAGMDLANHAVPKDVDNDVLVLEVDHPGWSQEVLMKKDLILRKIRKKYPELGINRMRIHVRGRHT